MELEWTNIVKVFDEVLEYVSLFSPIVFISFNGLYCETIFGHEKFILQFLVSKMNVCK